jgi:HD-GYP domain-containing protein (c-di-GMP phosphodiesterase class II)
VRSKQVFSLHLSNAFDAVRRQLGHLGLALSVWDAEAERTEQGGEEWGGASRSSGEDMRDAVGRQLARQVIAENLPGRAQTSWGEVLIAIPVYERRQLVAVAMASFPTVEMRDQWPANRHVLEGVFGEDVRDVGAHLERVCRYHANEADVLIEVLSATIEREKAMGIAEGELAGLSSNLATTYEELSLVYRISGSMNVTRDLAQFIREEVCEELLEVLNLEHVAVVIYPRREGREPISVVSCGKLDVAPEELIMFANNRAMPRLRSGEPYLVDNQFSPPAGSDTLEAIDRCVVVPLAGDDGPSGVLMAFNKIDDEFDSVDVKLLNAIGSNAAAFLNNHRLYSDLQELLIGVLEALTESIDAKDPYTCGHSRRVARISQTLAEMMGFDEQRVRLIYISGLLHDVGKIGVPESVLRKPGRLTAEEFELMKQHPRVGSRILSGIRQLDDVVVGILSHHERPDGRGYPDGLRGEEIPIEGRIIGLADTFDAMTSDRTYRKALPVERVAEEIRKYKGTQFDPVLADHFLSLDLNKFVEELRRESEEH